MKILIINGPNINMLGIREPEIYGHESYDDLVEMTRENARKISERRYEEGKDKIFLSFVQSNHEGEIVTAIQKSLGEFDAIVINPAAYTHTSIAIPDAIKAVGLPTVEVHISDINGREDYRKHSYTREACVDSVIGNGLKGYTEAIEILEKYV